MTRHGSLCSGYTGLDMAVHEVLGGELAWVSDIEPGPCALLEARYPQTPNLGDLTAVDWSSIEPVDVLTAGYPCQGESFAGKRKGHEDDRWVWPHIAGAIRVLRPRYVVAENVRGHLSLGFGTVLADLAALGFDAEWVVVRASDVGACHRRERIFWLAWDATCDDGRDARVEASSGAGRSSRPSRGAGLQLAADADGRRLQERAQLDSESAQDAADGGACGRHVDGPVFGPYAAAVRRHEAALGRAAPAPTDDEGRLSPLFVEWMMMLPAGWVTDIITTRTAALRLLGNGVVPAQAAYALRLLMKGAGRSDEPTSDSRPTQDEHHVSEAV